jgi:hypothetical protein
LISWFGEWNFPVPSQAFEEYSCQQGSARDGMILAREVLPDKYPATASSSFEHGASPYFG